MSINISATDIGKFRSPEQARAYLETTRIKSVIETAGQSVARFDNQSQDHNSDPGIVVCTNLSIQIANYNQATDAMVTYDTLPAEKPAEAPVAPPPPPPRRGFLKWLGPGPKHVTAPPPPAVPAPKKKITSVSIELARQPNAPANGQPPQVQMSMLPCDQGTRYHYKWYNDNMTFVEDKCGNLVIESTNLVTMPPE